MKRKLGISIYPEKSTIEKDKEYIEVSFSNFYIDKKLEKGFVIVRESNLRKGRHGGKVEIYFFENKGNRWKLYKNEMLLTA